MSALHPLAYVWARPLFQYGILLTWQISSLVEPITSVCMRIVLHFKMECLEGNRVCSHIHSNSGASGLPGLVWTCLYFESKKSSRFPTPPDSQLVSGGEG